MIKASKGVVEIEGFKMDLMAELMGIVKTFKDKEICPNEKVMIDAIKFVWMDSDEQGKELKEKADKAFKDKFAEAFVNALLESIMKGDTE